MKTEVISTSELSEFTHTDLTMTKAILLGGERLMVCDEAVALKDDAGRILGVASIAPEGEGGSGVPTIVGLYTILEARNGALGVNVGYTVFEATVRRCIERGFSTVRVDAMSSYAKRILLAGVRETPKEGLLYIYCETYQKYEN